MAIEKLTTRVTTPSDSLPPGRGFYQIEEDTLFVPIGRHPHGQNVFFSFLESDNARLDVDRTGRLLFLEISLSRRLWEVVPGLTAPVEPPYADVRWLDFRERFPEPVIKANSPRNLVCIQFSLEPVTAAHSLASSVVLEVDATNAAVGLWVTEIVDDLAGKQIAAFRQIDHPL